MKLVHVEQPILPGSLSMCMNVLHTLCSSSYSHHTLAPSGILLGQWDSYPAMMLSWPGTCCTVKSQGCIKNFGTELRYLKSLQNLTVPSFFGTKTTEWNHLLLEGSIVPKVNIKLTSSIKALCRNSGIL